MANPVLTKFSENTRTGYRPFGPQSRTQTAPGPGQSSTQQLEDMYNQPAYGGPTYPPTTGGGGGGGWGGSGGGGFSGSAAPSRYMTLDDVVVRTGAMLAVLFAAGAVAWTLTPSSSAGGLILVGAMGGVGLGLYMAFTMRANAALCLIYSAFQGLFLGAISRLFESAHPGIVVQALTGTVMVAAGVLAVYKFGAIRVTQKFTRIVVAATIGVFGLMLVNLIAYLFHPGGLGLRSGGAFAIIFSLICIGIAALNLVIDFDIIERGIRQGADEKFAWYASFGLMVTLIWLYLEILRLLGYLRE